MVRIGKPGIYRVDRTVLLDDNTVLSCVKGVVLKKEGRYPQVLLNRAALEGGTNVNITVCGLELRCNEQDMVRPADSPLPNLRGQIAFVRARNVTIRDFVCREYGLVGSCQYCLQFVGFDGLLVEDFDIQGGKDAIHLDYGRNFAIRNGRLRSADDGVALNAGDWPGGVTPMMGSITDGIIENVEDMPGGRWNFVRVITGVWTDWQKGMRLQTDDLVRVGKRIYCVWPMPRGRQEDGAPHEWTSDTMPTHGSGVWKSPEGINFQFLQDDGNIRADITNVVIRNCRLNADRGVFCAWEINDYARLIHPRIPHADYPRIDIRIEGCTKATKTPLVYGCASARVVLDNVKCAGPMADLHCLPENWPDSLPSPYYANRTLVVENCDFQPGDREGADIFIDDPRGKGTARVVLRGNRATRSVAIASSVPQTTVEGDTPYRRVPAAPCRIDVRPGESVRDVRDRVRALTAEDRRHGVEVVFPAGTYSLREPLELTAVDGGTAAGPVWWRAKEGAKVVFTAGVGVNGCAPVAPGDVNADRIDPLAKPRVYVADLKDADIEYWSALTSVCSTPPLPDLMVDGVAFHPAEWPNGATNWATIAAFRDSGRFLDSDDDVHFSCRRIVTAEDGKETWTKGMDALPVGGLFRYSGSRPERWVKSRETWLNGFWAFDWHSGIVPVEKVCSRNKEIRLALAYDYGVRAVNKKVPRRWKAIHVLEELDSPGEYFIDRWNRRLYFIPMRSLAADSDIRIVSGRNPMITMTGLRNFVLKGIEFTVAKADVVVGKGLRGVVFDGLRFHDVSSLAMNLEDARDCRVTGCDFVRTGTGSICLTGGDRRKLAPGGNVVEDCLFQDYSLRKKSHGYALKTMGVGNVARHCVFTGGGHQVTMMNGNDNLMEFCIISNCVNATGDAGACYQGRNPSCRGNVIRHCLFKDVGNSSQGSATCCVYYDDGAGGNVVEGCIFEDSAACSKKGEGYGAVFSHGGHSNRVVNCEFRNCSRPFGSTPWKQEKWQKFAQGPLMKKRMTEEVDVRAEPFKSHYPDLVSFFKPEPDEARWNLAEHNLIVDCGKHSGRWITNDNASVSTLIRDFKKIPRDRIGLLTPR